MPTVSNISIYNKALGLVGAEAITSPSDDNKEARLYGVLFEFARNLVLAEHPWNFATKRLDTFTQLTSSSYEYTYALQLPVDYLEAINVYPEGMFYDIADNLLYTNTIPDHLKYIAKVTNAAKFSQTFVEALAYKLAAELAYPLKQSNSLADRMEAKYIQKLRNARSANSRSKPMGLAVQDTFIQSRHSGNIEEYPV